MPFRPGVGVGGHCIPVDPLYLTWWARQNGGRAPFVELADSINHQMPKYIAERALSMVDTEIRIPRVLILGVAYKSGVSDVRETPVSELRDYLMAQGAEVAWHDPLVPVWGGSDSVELDWDCDVAILATKQPGMYFKRLIDRGVDIHNLRSQLKSPHFFSMTGIPKFGKNWLDNFIPDEELQNTFLTSEVVRNVLMLQCVYLASVYSDILRSYRSGNMIT
jgi:hypothetical protein